MMLEIIMLLSLFVSVISLWIAIGSFFIEFFLIFPVLFGWIEKDVMKGYTDLLTSIDSKAMIISGISLGIVYLIDRYFEWRKK